MITVLLSVVSILVLGLAIVALPPAPPEERRPGPALLLSLSAGAGMGASSLLFFFWIALAGAPARYYSFFEAALAFILLPLCYSRIIRLFAGPRTLSSSLSYYAPFLVIAALALTNLCLLFEFRPHGAWDMFLNWGLRAKAMSDGAAGLSRSLPHAFNPDYPLLLPGLIGRFWAILPGWPVYVPISIAIVYDLLILVLLMSALKHFGKSDLTVSTAGAALLGSWLFLRLCSFQYADLPLAFQLLACFVCLAMSESGREPRWLILSSLFAGFGLWTKNEGQLAFFAFILTTSLFSRMLRLDNIRCFFAAIPSLAALVLFKTGWPALARLASIADRQMALARITSIDHWTMLAISFIKEPFLFHRWGFVAPALLMFPLIAGVSIPPGLRRSLATMAICFILNMAGWCVVFTFHPSTSFVVRETLSRLFMQLWPSIVFAVFVIVRDEA